jgi:hypothetical protein
LSTDLETFSNETAKFIVLSSTFEHDDLNKQLMETAKALEEAPGKEERKEILDQSLVMTITAYSSLASTLARYACFLCLAYKAEKLYKLDMQGLATDFRNDEEAFLWWVNEFLHKAGAKPGLRSKVRYVVSENNDMDLIDRVTFEKAYVLSRFKRKLRNLGVDLPVEAEIMAEKKDCTAKDLTDVLGWECVKHEKFQEYIEEHNTTPSHDEVEGWRKEHEIARDLKSMSYRRARAKDKGGVGLEEINRGDTASLVRFQRTLLDAFETDLDLGDDVFAYIHANYSRCVISGKESSPDDPIEVHHLLGRGASGADRRFCNLLPIRRSVHQELDAPGGGLEHVLEKYEVGVNWLASEALRVTLGYIKNLEKEAE